jgi:LacI family transcriptional regulator
LKQPRRTIIEVAERAKVSVGTVSHVLNGVVKVSPERRARVLKAIEEMGYTRNMLAQGLRRQRSRVVGLCVPHTTVSYFAALVNAFEGMAAARGYEMMQVLSRQDPATELERITSLLRYKVGGLILVPCNQPKETLDFVANSTVPVVVVDRPLANDMRFDQVTFDNRSAMHEAAKGLIGLGHRRILFVVRYRSLIVTQDRIEGLKLAAAEAQQPVTVDVMESGDDETSFRARLAAELKRQRYTAVVFSNSMAGAWIIRALRAFGLKCPDDISLLAFDEPEWADIISPSLAMVRQPTREIAQKAWELLIGRMNGEATEPRRIVLPPGPITLGETVGPAKTPALSGAA